MSNFFAITANYQTVVTRVPVAANEWVRVLVADPRRFFVRFEVDAAGIIVTFVGPGGFQNVLGPANVNNMPIESKWHDAPARTTGEWYAFVNPNCDILITEDLYVGE